MFNFDILDTMKTQKFIYLDNAATTAVDPLVAKAMAPFWNKTYGNPSSLYRMGVEAKQVLTTARADIAEILHCKPSELIFTSGGTESNNFAILGTAQTFQKTYNKPGHIITTAIEHRSVLHVIDGLKQWGWQISYAPVDKDGFVKLVDLKKLVRKDTALISVMYANNEIGTIEPIAEIGKWVTGLNRTRFVQKLPQIIFHTDACQASGSLSLNVHDLKVDLMTVNASKIYGPKGVGLLYIKSGIKVQPLIHGGGQEQNLRSGTENVAGVVGFAKALQLVEKNKLKENKKISDLRNYLFTEIKKINKKVILHGPELNKSELTRLPNNLNISFPNVEGEMLMLYLDAKGVQISTGSACATTETDPSHVLEAIGVKRKDAFNAVRITLGKYNTKAELNYFLKALKEVLILIAKSK